MHSVAEEDGEDGVWMVYVSFSSKVMSTRVFCMKFSPSSRGAEKGLSQIPAVVTDMSCPSLSCST